MFWRNPEAALLRFSKSSESAWCPSARWAKVFLTGAITKDSTFDKNDFRSTEPRLQKENIEANEALVNFVKSVAANKGCHARTVGARLRYGSEAMDCAYPWQKEAGAYQGQSRRSRYPVHRRGEAGHQPPSKCHRHTRRTLQRQQPGQREKIAQHLKKAESLPKV